MADITPQEIELAIALAEKVLSLLNGGKTAAQVAQEINDQTLANDRWLRDHGFFPPNTGA
jgi:hypothetical protein